MALIGGVVALLAPLAAAAEGIIIGVYAYPPFEMEVGGRPSGYAHEILDAVARRAGFDVQTADVPVVRATKMLRDTPNLLIAGTKSGEAVANYGAAIWGFCFEAVTHALIVKADRPYVGLESLPRDALIGAFLGYTLKGYLAERGFSAVELASTNEQVADMLMHDRVEAWASLEGAARYILDAKGIPQDAVRAIPLRSLPFCAIAGVDTNPQVLDRLRAAYDGLVADGGRAAIRARYARFLGPDRAWP